MNLDTQSKENIEYMLESIKDKLQIVNASALNSKNFDTEHYEDLRDIYLHVQKKSNFSVSELDAIVTELGQLRK
ncbi:DUF1128 domain-containing protein [Bacillus sp. JCM 19034]|uniref:DUF1128 domain-containing protein n=1 Tax=Bacillus sp. JCM 19034 TaxID=1481928 RepID=UPI0007836733|nr:DUF1128 domain-containing protein [Bacillus sp. JCM 19034]